MPVVAGRATAQVICEEAARMLFQRGYDATSLQEGARAVGLTVDSLYNHIDSTENLLQQVMGGTIADLLALQQEALLVN